MIKSLVLSMWLLATPSLQDVTEGDFELHPALGVVVTVGDYEVAYPILATNPVLECHQIISVDIEVTLCYNRTQIVLGEPTMFKPAWCEHCIWQSMDEFPQGEK